MELYQFFSIVRFTRSSIIQNLKSKKEKTTMKTTTAAAAKGATAVFFCCKRVTICCVGVSYICVFLLCMCLRVCVVLVCFYACLKWIVQSNKSFVLLCCFSQIHFVSVCVFNIPISKVSFISTPSLGSLQLPALTGWIGRKQAMMTALAMTTERHVKVLWDSPRLRIRNWSNEDGGGGGNGDDDSVGGGSGGFSIFIIVHLWPKNLA